MKKLKTTIKDFLSEQKNLQLHSIISDERIGFGDAIDLSKNEFNIIFNKNFPDYLLNVHDTATMQKYWEETLNFFKWKKKKLDKELKLYTSQKYISSSFLNYLEDNNDNYDESDIILVYDRKGRIWILDGHHRLYFDRKHNRDSLAYILSSEDVKEIDYIYSDEDD
jgi:hypothetical protein